MPFLENKRHIFIQGDICDQELLKELFSSNTFDCIINFAAESHVDNSIKDPMLFMNTNVIGLVNLLNNALEHWHDLSKHLFVQISTDEVYGSLDNLGSFFEDSIIKPNSPYSASKASADLIAMSYYRTYGLPVIVTRSVNNFGPRQNKEKLIPKTIINSINRDSIPIYGSGKNIRSWIYVVDNCRFILLLLNYGKPGKVYNIGVDYEIDNLSLVRKINNIISPDIDLIVFVEDRLGHDFRYSVNTNLLLDTIGSGNEITDFDIGLKLTIKYYLESDHGE
jgi:dTDP-glucose 4,6-dehydratase